MDKIGNALEKESGIELLSRSQVCSTIVAGPLIDRVRDGNVSCKPAIDTGKKVKDADGRGSILQGWVVETS